ncbi:MAG: 50S ribosomal protein L29 [Candidatus Levybacteria bacterium CG_4_10_14_0_2_um_filter_36_16]|nr:MAG: 50S ribosomal protein L29 [Candidatus Levybacteria bacterium CG2_30_37_29]PIR79297.1 MAG: 50S ribosomal protein L29 [Candidatus Levybacteria bacterium CG10_big_fil_rev_8_21_14_0_10_36_30]PIZ97124.1 MAG: 50S ribosomal protein L29 [Candidatus Levybacteria bacterium CG_4_10_14_0_2_um_filter_36_16]PJA90205.1 MAG: 50S ribosomal protein L29 [Candidatus Levybacteria bacterium CG_4_9_14_3_um_filter_36_7]
MKKNLKAELYSRTVNELKKELFDTRAEVGKLKIEIAARKNKDTAGIRTKRKNIARIMTIILQKEFKGKENHG